MSPNKPLLESSNHPRTPLKKKQKVVAAPSGAGGNAAANAVVPSDDAADEAMMAKFMAKCSEKFVTKEEIKKNYVTKEEHALTKGNLKKVDDELALTKGKLAQVSGQLAQMADAFAPATKHALFEEAIGTFAMDSIPDAWKGEKDMERVQYSVTWLCYGVLDMLLARGTSELGWRGPSVSGSQRFLKSKIRPLVLAGLAGLVCYIQQEEKDTIETRISAMRNAVAQDGKFLDGMFGTPDGKSRPAYDNKKDDVKTKRTAFVQAKTMINTPTDIDNGVSCVVSALTNKGITTQQEDEREVCKQLKRIAPS